MDDTTEDPLAVAGRYDTVPGSSLTDAIRALPPEERRGAIVLAIGPEGSEPPAVR